MTSPTQKHKNRRAHKLVKQGKKRKNAIRNNGTTAPDLALSKPNAHELAQITARAAASKLKKKV